MAAYLKKTSVLLPLVIMLFGNISLSMANDVDSLLLKADSLRKAYLFGKSLRLYDQALSATSDSAAIISIQDRKMLSENGLGMTDFVLQPTVVARHRFSVDDFYLYYPLEDGSWRPVPNVLDTLGTHPLYKAIYFPEGLNTLYYSAPDAEGTMNIYRTEKKDSVWSVPGLLNEYMVSSEDEIYPMLSPDGKHLYFASAGLYGMGGFDLYVSTWNEDQQEWGPPSNMGMPYSSPFNDFLFMNTPDGKYTIFASDRDCPADSVDVYVLEQESMPVRKSVDDVGQLRRIMSLDPAEDFTAFDNSTVMSRIVPQDVDTGQYTDKVSEVRSLRDSIYYYNIEIDGMRTRFMESADIAEKDRLTLAILGNATRISVLQDSLENASAELQKIEMEFLFKGIVLDPDELMSEADREVEGVSSNYVFARMNPGEAPDMVIEKPAVKFDYTFMILPVGRFAEDNTLPDGIVYQIQIFSLSSRTDVSELRGLSPVFEEITPSGRYVYRAGVFRTYNGVLSNLNKVKRLGFRTAFIAAFNDGEPIPVSQARALEKQVRSETMYQVRIVPYDGQLPDLTIPAIEQLAGKKDVARSVENGKVTYIVGPFSSKQLVDKVVVAVKATNVADVRAVKISTGETDRK